MLSTIHFITASFSIFAVISWLSKPAVAAFIAFPIEELIWELENFSTLGSSSGASGVPSNSACAASVALDSSPLAPISVRVLALLAPSSSNLPDCLIASSWVSTTAFCLVNSSSLTKSLFDCASSISASSSLFSWSSSFLVSIYATSSASSTCL